MDFPPTQVSQNPPSRANYFHSMSLGLFIFLPALMFAVISCVFIFAFHNATGLVWFTIALCLSISIVFMVVRHSRASPPFWFNLGLLCLISVIFGAGASMMNYERGMSKYHAYEGQREYVNVVPNELALSHLDAGKITFSSDAHLDFQHSATFRDGDIYCIVPVVGKAAVTQIQYWAAGTNCCEHNRNFTCDDAANIHAKEGLVYLDVGVFANNADVVGFRKAVKEATAAFSLKSSNDAVFVRWVANSDEAQRGYWNSSVGFIVGSTMIYLVISLVIGLTIHFSSRPPKNKQVPKNY